MRQQKKFKEEPKAYDAAKCPTCKGQRYVYEKSFFRCAYCSELVDVVGRPVKEVKNDFVAENSQSDDRI